MTKQISAPTPPGVLLSRDSDGIPHIKANSLQDAYWGMGYCHALDRSLQMVLMRVLGQGRACQCLEDSDQLLEMDLFFRRMNWRGNMKKSMAGFEPETKTLLGSYCKGVNARFAEKKRTWELALVGYRPSPWKIEDTLMLSRMTGYLTLAQSQAEIERLLVEMVQAGIDDQRLEALFPGNLKGLDRDLLSKVTLGERIVPDALKWLSPVPRSMASNSWIISGQRTQSKKPIMSNDLHLEINRLPAVWVEQVVQYPGNYWVGANMPGLPAPLVGRSAHLAWGATYSFADTVDSWIEHCRGGQYRRGEDTWLDFETRTETIKRKKYKDLTVTFYENEHGVLDGEPQMEGYYLATCWAPSQSGVASLNAACSMWRARTVGEGMDCLGRIDSSWNWVLADDAGDIGFQMSGQIPQRGADITGFVPLPGWQAENDWQGFVPHTELPRVINPIEGFFVTANQDLNAHGKVAPINMPMGDYRARRISELLGRLKKATIKDCNAIQMDLYSIQAAEFLVVLRPLLPDTETGRLLAGWDLCYDLDSKGAVAFEQFYGLLMEELFAPGLGKPVHRHLTDTTGVFIDFYQHFDRLLLAESSPWHGKRTREEIFKAAAHRLPACIKKTWGEVNRITLTNIFFSGKLPQFLGFDRGPIPLKGGRATPHQGQIYQSAGRTTSFAPSLRLIADLASKELHTSMPGGPRDRRFCKWYNSGTAQWLVGDFKTLAPAKD